MTTKSSEEVDALEIKVESNEEQPEPSVQGMLRQDGNNKSFSSILASKLKPFVKRYWFLAGLGFVIGIAYADPTIAKSNGPLEAQYSIKYGAVAIIFFLSGLSLRTAVLAKEILRIRLHLTTQVISLLLIPAFVYGITLFFGRVHLNINSYLITGLIIAACCPTTVSSNVVMTKNARGNEYAACTNAALGNVLGIFVSPLMVNALVKTTGGGGLDFGSVMLNLGCTVLAPLVVGQIIQYIWPKTVSKLYVKCRGSELNLICLLLLVWSIFSDAFANQTFNALRATDIIAVLITNTIFYVLYSLFCVLVTRLPWPWSLRIIERLRYSREDTVAVMYCGATKTVAMGVPLINVLYKDQNPGLVGVLSTPLIMYHIGQMVLGSIEVSILLKWVQKGQMKDRLEGEEASE
ncbi:hypothetical protein BZG36_03608 [Bifiguratus adelaidae]|uniref:Uncharacterized protein n=1 Tax=Bifiguratus adelaidae TaxID=1938954 RepID=A0A261Y012_9FUNG|nr:hypothetical protein BZG36_03608 [Bifiguratus adelaidae]